MSKHDLNTAAFLQCVGPLLKTPEVNSMKQWERHYFTNCYDHSLFVSYVAFRLARFLGWNYRSAARAGLLHDLYLYDPTDSSAHPGNQCLDHPEFALRNAMALCPDLTENEKNAIVSHMFPLAVHLPRCREALAVGMADKLCATLELVCLTRTRMIRNWLPTPARS